MLHGGRSRPQQFGAALSDDVQLSRKDSRIVPTFLACKAFAQRDGNRAGHGLTGQTRQLTGQPAGFLVLGIEAHGRPPGRITCVKSTLRGAAIMLKPEGDCLLHPFEQLVH